MPSFQPINGLPTPTSSTNQSSQASANDEPEIEIILDSEHELPELHQAEWPVNAVDDKKLHLQERRFLIRWKDSIIREELIRSRFDGSLFVRIVEADWEVESMIYQGQDEEGFEICEVRWQRTWQPASTLANAKGTIAAFERRQKQRVEENPARAKAQRPVEEVRLAATSHRVRAEAPPHFIFTPESNVDYRCGYRALTRAAEGDASATLRKWPEENDKRPLLFRGGTEVNCLRDEKKRATFYYLQGFEQSHECEPCQEGRGPFPNCVVAAGHANGTCTNCVFTKSRRCNFNKRCKRRNRAISWDSANMYCSEETV